MSSIPLRYQRLVAFVQRLAEATAEKRATWVPIDNPALQQKGVDEAGKPPSAFEYSRPSGEVQIVSRDGDNYAPYRLYLVRDGKEIEELNSEWWGEEDEYPAAWNDILADLYSLARASALKIDATLDALAADLDKSPADDDIPF